MRRARSAFSNNAPRWFVLNEISRGAWNGSAAYRTYVGDLVARLHNTYRRKVLVFSPFWRPGYASANNPAAWKRVAAAARIGVENYLSGAQIKAHGFNPAWCKSMYAQSITWYSKMGVAAGRLVLTEHFAQTKAGAEWGRAGVSAADWEHAIRVRTQAARSLPFFGYASYAWGVDQMGIADFKRRSFQDLYHRLMEGTDLTIPGAAPPPSNPPVDAGSPPPSNPAPDAAPPPSDPTPDAGSSPSGPAPDAAPPSSPPPDAAPHPPGRHGDAERRRPGDLRRQRQPGLGVGDAEPCRRVSRRAG